MRSTAMKSGQISWRGSLRCWTDNKRAGLTGLPSHEILALIKEALMANDNIFSGLKVVDLSTVIAGPAAAVILSDFGANVIKVEPPTGDIWRIGHKLPPQPSAKEDYPWQL